MTTLVLITAVELRGDEDVEALADAVSEHITAHLDGQHGEQRFTVTDRDPRSATLRAAAAVQQ